ncbi:MAG: sterol desaturase family protein [Gammaproteobacteria bacterium]|nr:sterol desaturase family protein [Gammaproteobacteria bacterium]
MPTSNELNKNNPVTSRRNSSWNYTPTLPVNVSPYFNWPPKIGAAITWIVRGWFPVSERLIILILAIVSALFFQPTLSEISELSMGVIAQIYLRNMALMTLVAGGLHWYFYIARMQGDDRRYDTRPFSKKSRVFTFGSQVRDNVFWTLASGVTVWTLYEVLMLWSLSHGYAPSLTLPHQWPWLVLLVALIPMWETTHFFLIHRLIHSSKLYQRVHALHHRNTNVGPWSGMSMHPIEHLVYLSTVLIHFIVPSSPFLIAFHLMYFTLSAATTHTGYQGIVQNGKLLLPLGTFHHQLHHRYFTCNYGGLEIPWDQWTGSFHDGTEQSHQAFLSRRKQKA